MHPTDKYSGHRSIILPVSLNSWVLFYQPSDSALDSCCSHLSLRFRYCFEQGISRHSGNYGVWIHSKRSTWHDKNIQSNAPYIYILRTELSHLVRLAKWLNVRLQVKCFWVRVQNAVTYISDFLWASRKEFLDIQVTIESGFTRKRVRAMTRSYSQMHRKEKVSEHRSIIW